MITVLSAEFTSAKTQYWKLVSEEEKLKKEKAREEELPEERETSKG